MTTRVRRPVRLTVGRGVIDAHDIHGRDDRRPLVLLHEGLGSKDLWRDLDTDLAAATGRRVVAFSRHGYGRSAVVPEPREVDYLHREGQDVLPAVLAALGMADPVLVGHSDGASIALIAVGSGAVAAAGLAVMAPHVIVEDVTVEGVVAAREVYADDAEGGWRRALARHHDAVDATFRGWNDVWRSPAFRDWDITDLLGGIGCPVLALQGIDDRYATMRQIDLVEQGVAGPVTRVEVPDCDHVPHAEQPEATRAALVDWLADLP